MINVTIANVQYQVDEPVYRWMRDARNVIEKAKALREAQKEFFRHHDQGILRKCKALESELDDLIAGNTPEKKALQQELFT